MSLLGYFTEVFQFDLGEYQGGFIKQIVPGDVVQLFGPREKILISC